MGFVRYLNLETLHQNPAFTQAIVVSGTARTIYVGGQNAVDAQGNIIGKGDIGAQAEQIFRNMELILAEAGAGLEHVVKWTIYIKQGQPLGPGFQAFQRAWGNRPNPPTITTLYVAGLAHPDYLVEIDAIAVVPE